MARWVSDSFSQAICRLFLTIMIGILHRLAGHWSSGVADGDRPSRSLIWVIPLLVLGTAGCTASNSPPGRSDAADPTATSLAAETEEAATNPTSSTPSTAGKVAPSPDELCANVEAGDPQQLIGLTNLQFHRPAPIPFQFEAMDEADEPVEHLIGCITNRTDQTISGVQLQIDFQTQDGSGFAAAQIEFPGANIAPGQTVPFKHSTEFDTDLTELTITEVTTLEPMPGHEEYAFQKIATFRPEIEVAYVPAKASASEPMTDLCADVAPSTSDADAPIAVNKLQIYDLPQDTYDFREGSESILIGCVTNLTEEPIPGLGVAYKGNYSDFAGATIELPVEVIQSGETVPFRKYGELDAGTEALYVYSIGDLEINGTVTRQGVSQGE